MRFAVRIRKIFVQFGFAVVPLDASFPQQLGKRMRTQAGQFAGFSKGRTFFAVQRNGQCALDCRRLTIIGKYNRLSDRRRNLNVKTVGYGALGSEEKRGVRATEAFTTEAFNRHRIDSIYST